MRSMMIALAMIGGLLALGCAEPEPEEDWTHAEAYFECFFGAYGPYVDGLTVKNDQAIAEAVTHARKQCHVPSRGALKSAEQGRRTEALRACLLQAEEIISTTYGEQIDLTQLQVGWVPMLQFNVCQPHRTDRINSHLDGSEAS